ncbi:MAG: hypothetical protein ACFE8E_08220 [Candidatus Hodarchaeota archaeon]
MSLICFYHPKRDAITKCEMCGKPICVECKEIFHAIHGGKDDTYSTHHEICKVCYYDKQIELATKKVPLHIVCLIFIISFTIVLIISIVFTYPFPIINIILPIILGIILACLIFSFFKIKSSSRSKSELLVELKTKKDAFLKLVKEPICPECGGQIDSLVSICPHCGYQLKGV